MEAVTLPQSRALTRADLGLVPDDGHRYELVDGALIVTPAPSRMHQRVSGALFVLLRTSCPGHLEVLAAPFDVALADDTVVQPDLLVAHRDAFTERDLPTTPLLAVEILSPSTRLLDLTLKRARYEAAGCASYWVIDPLEVRLLAWEVREGAYAQVADVSGDEAWLANSPYAVEIRPIDLTR